MKFRDYYEILGVNDAASAEEIKRAYRKKARQYHPDVSKEEDAEEKFKLVGEAYEVLRDTTRREEYDQLKKQGFRGGDDFRGGGNWYGQQQPGAGAYSGAGDFSEFFNAIFGSAGMGAGQGGTGAGFGYSGNRGFGRGHPNAGFNARNGSANRGSPNTGSPNKGADVRLRVRVSLELAYQGGKTTVKVPGKDGGNPKSLSVTIPAGVLDGQQLRLRGQGSRAVAGGRAGDLLMIIEIKQHDMFTVDGADISMQFPITPLESVDGLTVLVPTLGGEVNLKIPAGTASGSKLRLRGRGLPADTAGDQYVTVQITLPEELSSHQRKLLEEFDSTIDHDLRFRSWKSKVV